MARELCVLDLAPRGGPDVAAKVHHEDFVREVDLSEVEVVEVPLLLRRLVAVGGEKARALRHVGVAVEAERNDNVAPERLVRLGELVGVGPTGAATDGDDFPHAWRVTRTEKVRRYG